MDLFQELCGVSDALVQLRRSESFAGVLTSVLKRAARAAGHWELIEHTTDMAHSGEHRLKVLRTEEPGKGKTYTVIIRPDKETHR